MASGNVRNSFDNNVDSFLSFLDNEYVAAGVSLFLVLYAGIIAPKLPAYILGYINNWFVQLALFFAIVYVSNKNATVALIAAVAVLVTLMVANKKITYESLKNKLFAEGFTTTSKLSNNDNEYEMYDKYYEQNEKRDREMEYNLNTRVSGVNDADDVEGIMEDHIEEHDRYMAGMRHAIDHNEGAVTSKNGPRTKQEHKQENDDNDDNVSNDKMLSGVPEYHADEDSMGSSLDGESIMCSEHGSVDN